MVCGRVHVCACALPGLPSEGNGADQTGIYYTTAPLTSRHHCGHYSTITCVLLVLGRLLAAASPAVAPLVVGGDAVFAGLGWAGEARRTPRHSSGVFWMVRTFLLFRLHHAAKAKMVVAAAAEMPSIPVSDGRGDHLTRTHTPT